MATTEMAAVAADVFAGLFVGQHVGDHVAQTHADAQAKAIPTDDRLAAGANPWTGWSACLRHATTTTLTQAAALALVWMVAPLTAAGTVAALVVSVVSHAAIDRRWIVRAIIRPPHETSAPGLPTTTTVPKNPRSGHGQGSRRCPTDLARSNPRERRWSTVIRAWRQPELKPVAAIPKPCDSGDQRVAEGGAPSGDPRKLGRPQRLNRQPDVPPPVHASFAELIGDLAAARVPGLGSLRTAFRQAGHLSHSPDTVDGAFERINVQRRLLERRFELLIGSRLHHARVLRRIRADTPDFDCIQDGFEFGVEATTRARPEAASAFHDLLEAALHEGPDVQITVNRTNALLFTDKPDKLRSLAHRLVDDIAAHHATGHLPYSFDVPELKLTAFVESATCLTQPGMRVTYQAMLASGHDRWEHHLTQASQQIRDTIKAKGAKSYDRPSIVVLDVSRLGEASRYHDAPWREALAQAVESCDLGNVGSVLVVRSDLVSHRLTGLVWHGHDDLRRAADAVLAPAFVS